ncbi:disintegrin and metalloproteinase with thrombospondin motifs 9-like protein [Dinothrombium tinctorium]|uniref:Disintegrin and metalloproteinase with thrombospondin motifs 9-like protein n=1 Tax=Dinothrombium tinctorium TaxID=1965070 RepID=A0A3S3P6B3_9ACAR|nr:disintegrin and metalloproteinase with thrombospondin motifs 9-like protein [Dinothrombium tinctorium]
MVVADSSMARYHGDNLKHYILILMETVASMYRDASIGNWINIAVVRLAVMSSEEEKELINTSASKKLRHFCKWQKQHNYEDDKHPLHHDVAILLTREDLCRMPATCDTLGIAQSGKICDPSASCAIIEDNGLSAVFTIAHELGHVLNIPHDDDEKCKRFHEHGQKHNIMARTLDYNSNLWSWSRCSQHYITEFFDAGEGHCLLDEPKGNFLQESHNQKNYAESRHPGEVYDMDYQCELVFGPTSKICPYMPACKRLWCTVSNNGGCRTQHMPWADGTPCGRHKHCIHGECVPVVMTTPAPIHGQWGEWSEWSECSRSCGGGVKKSTRECNQPKPAHNGRYCKGRRVRYMSCNTHECSSGTPDFREEQCAAFNGQTFNIQGLPSDVKWVPHYVGIGSTDNCKLYCRVYGKSMYYMLKSKVIDGTPCIPDSYDICVNGQCQKAGCDHVLGSDAKLDSCGVCGGDNSTCKVINRTFNQIQVQYGYNSVAAIPAGASNIEITQPSNAAHDNNYLVLRSSDGSYLLNGDYSVSMFKRTIQYSGVAIDYSGSNELVERINCSKPIKKSLYVEVLSVGDLLSPEVRYQYSVSVKQNEASKWSLCSAKCGRGYRTRTIECLDWTNTSVPHHFCLPSDKPKPYTKCKRRHCPFVWQTSPWSRCSVSCGFGWETRTVTCHRMTKHGFINPVPVANIKKLADVSYSMCNMTIKPISRRQCNYGSCNGKGVWKPEPWQNCSAPCGHGFQKRKVACYSLTLRRKVARSYCDPRLRPKRRIKCFERPCVPAICDELRNRIKLMGTDRYKNWDELREHDRMLFIYCTELESNKPMKYPT